jgi:acyl carrier protein
MTEVTVQALGTAWSTVLDLDVVDGATDFFVSGGDSLAIAELQAILADDLGIMFQFSDLLEHSTPEKFYDYLVQRQTTSR